MGGGKKLALDDICHSVFFHKSRQGKKEGGGNKNITKSLEDDNNTFSTINNVWFNYLNR